MYNRHMPLEMSSIRQMLAAKIHYLLLQDVKATKTT